MTTPAAERDGPYFFLSHAHPIEQIVAEMPAYNGAQQPSAPGQVDQGLDHWVSKVCRDLSDTLANRINGSAGRQGAFQPCEDVTATRDGNLSAAVTAADSFLALYSESYAGDDLVRTQRIAFAEKVQDAGQRIVPVLWEPSPRIDPTAVAAALAVVPDVAEYAEHGLLALTRLTDAVKAAAYQSTLAGLTEWIARLVQDRPAIRQLPADWQPLHPRATETFIVAVLAPTWTELLGPSDWYGTTELEWSPFNPDHPEPIGKRVAALVNPDVYVPQLVEATTAAAPADEYPGILLIDPWIAKDPDGQRRLSDVLRRTPDWMPAALVACGEKWQAGRHLEALNSAEKSVLDPAHSPPSHRPPDVLRSVENFDKFFRALLLEARRRFVARRPTKLPERRYTPRPTIRTRAQAEE